MLPDRVSNPGPLTYESGALPIALRGPADNVDRASTMTPPIFFRELCPFANFSTQILSPQKLIESVTQNPFQILSQLGSNIKHYQAMCIEQLCPFVNFSMCSLNNSETL